MHETEPDSPPPESQTPSELLVSKYKKRSAKGTRDALFPELVKEIEADRAARKEANKKEYDQRRDVYKDHVCKICSPLAQSSRMR